MKRAVAMVGVGLAALVSTGCSVQSDGEAAPEPKVSMRGSPEPSGSSGLPHSGAPAVTNPLPESVLSDHPCEVLTTEQLQSALGPEVSAGSPSDLEQVGPGCHWRNPETLGALQIGFSVVTREGLSAQYANTKPQVAVFRELSSVGGFPGVAYKASEKDRFCTVAVGVADEYSITTGVGLSPDKAAEGVDSCVPAEQVAEMVVGNLKAKAGR